MLKIIRPINNTSSDRLARIWHERYVPDLSLLYLQDGGLDISELVEVASKEGRAKTVTKLRCLIQINCECAGIKTDALFSYIPNIVNLTEAQRLAQFVWQVYDKVLEIYLQQLPVPNSLTTVSSPSAGDTDMFENVFKQWAMPAVEMLAITLEPLIQQLRDQYILASDRRTIGFISTQFHFSSELVLNRLTLPEQVLLSPYFQFIEEQVCIPLQRVCRAAAKHRHDSPNLDIVLQLLPASQEIASAVYCRAAQSYPHHRSLRGNLLHPKVKVSAIRDLQMFQGYLWLCLLEENMAVMEKELLPLCVVVFPSVDVAWDLVRQMLQMLVDELTHRLERDRANFLLPYTQAMQQLFSNIGKKTGESYKHYKVIS